MRLVGDERNSRHGTGFVNCGAQRNLKMWGPLLKIITNVKVALADPLTICQDLEASFGRR